MNANFYTHPQEIWNDAKCSKVANSRRKDALGTRHPFKGFVSSSSSSYCELGQSVRYNGGCIRNGEHYAGETKPLPQISENFRFIIRPTWGIYLERVK